MLNVPSVLVIGDTATWRDSLTGPDPQTGATVNYSPDSYSLLWAFRGSEPIDVTAIADGDRFLSQITSEQSSTLTAGQHFWQAFIFRSSYRLTIGSGTIQVVTDLAAIEGVYDGRSEKEKELAKVEAAISAVLDGKGVQSYSIKGRSLSRFSLSELYSIRDRLKTDIFREKNPGARLYVGFGRID